MNWKALGIALAFLISFSIVAAQEEAKQEEGGKLPVNGLGFIGVALTIGLSSLSAGYAIAHAGSAAIGAIAERPEVATWGLIIVALAEGIALYGLVIAFMLLGKL